MEIKKVGVLGCGLMGSGIAQTAASAGFETVVREVSDELLQKGFAGIEKFICDHQKFIYVHQNDIKSSFWVHQKFIRDHQKFIFGGR